MFHPFKAADLLVAADVFIYVGALDQVFREAYRAPWLSSEPAAGESRLENVGRWFCFFLVGFSFGVVFSWGKQREAEANVGVPLFERRTLNGSLVLENGKPIKGKLKGGLDEERKP